MYLERARALAPLISGEAATIERDASVSKAVVDALVEQELFWCLLPGDLGGGGLRMTDAIRVGEEISRADGSTGWAFMATGFSTAVIAGFVEQDVAREYFLGDRKEIIAGQLLPRHPGLKVDGGYLLGAGWSFASGSDFASHGRCDAEPGVPAGRDRPDAGSVGGVAAAESRRPVVGRFDGDVPGAVRVRAPEREDLGGHPCRPAFGHRG
jgi:hypothetical protein